MTHIRVIHHFDKPTADRLRDYLASASAESGVCGEHDPRWLSVLREALGHRTLALLATDDTEGRITGYLPLALLTSRLFGRFLVSLPYLNRAGIVAEDASTRDALLRQAADLADRFKVQYLELRHHTNTFHHELISQNRDDKVRMMLDLPASVEDLWSAYSAKVRNQVRKGDKADLRIRFGRHELLDGFYHVFATNMRDLGTPVYPIRLFSAILDAFPNDAELIEVTHDGEPVAGALLLHQTTAGVMETQVPSASSLRSAKHTNANMWMYHHLLQRAIERGAQRFDFGRSSPDSGTYRFKRQWGAVPLSTTWQYYVRYGDISTVRPDNPRYQRRIATWQKLPVWVTRLVGPTIVKGIP